jgi:hypothetical protein
MFNELARLAQGSKAQQKTGTDTFNFKNIPRNYPTNTRKPHTLASSPTTVPKKLTHIVSELPLVAINLNMLEKSTRRMQTSPLQKHSSTASYLLGVAASLASTSKISISELSSMTSNTCTFKNGCSNKNSSMKNLHHLLDDKDRILCCEIRKGMYGLQQAGRLAYVKLIAHLKPAGYIRAGITPGLFRHTTNAIVFSLVFDDFGIRYTDKNDTQHFIDHLSKQYTCTVDWEGKIFLSMHLEWDYINRTVTITMPGYVKKALICFEHIASFLH